LRATTADAKVRAGFMLVPEIGLSNVMYAATKHPAIKGVYRDRRIELLVKRIIVMSRKAMTISARKAVSAP
jgi:hypothetical protein